MQKVHYHGYGRVSLDPSTGVELIHPITRNYDTLIRSLESLMENNSFLKDKLSVEDNYGFDTTNMTIPNATVRIYSDTVPFSLKEAESKLIHQLCGDIDAETEEFGYSEYTIMGFDINNFKIGGHDLMKILESLSGKYIHFIVETEIEVPEGEKPCNIDIPNGTEREKNDIPEGYFDMPVEVEEEQPKRPVDPLKGSIQPEQLKEAVNAFSKK